MKGILNKLFVLLAVIFPSWLLAQDFNIYYLQARYNKTEIDYLRSSSVFQKYYWFPERVLIPNRDGVLDEKSIIARLEIFFPKKDDDSYLSIDIEGKVIENLKNGKPGEKKFEASKKIFLDAVNIIKNHRPFLKVGIYGLPSRVYYEGHYKNDDKKLYPILEKCDYISPSLYIIYPDEERGERANDNYFRFNLERSLKISHEIGIPVIPYVWPVVHTINKKNGGRLISPSSMKRHIEFIKSYEYKGIRASGVLWWEEPADTKLFSKNLYPISKPLKKSTQGETGSSQNKQNINILIEATKGLVR